MFSIGSQLNWIDPFPHFELAKNKKFCFFWFYFYYYYFFEVLKCLRQSLFRFTTEIKTNKPIEAKQKNTKKQQEKQKCKHK